MFTNTGNLEPVFGQVPKICSFTSQEAQINHKLSLPYSCPICNITGNTDNIGQYYNSSPKHKTLSASAVCPESNIPPSPNTKNKYIKCFLEALHLLHKSFWCNMHGTWNSMILDTMLLMRVLKSLHSTMSTYHMRTVV